MISAVIQARMNSARLPKKVLLDIAGRPMFARVVERVQRARRLDSVLVATTDGEADDAVAAFCRETGIPCFRGSEADVLDRYCQAARFLKADVVVRVTADCPLIDPVVIDRVIERYLAGDCDYATNTLRYTYPDGLDVEVFSFAALERAWREARLPSHREHVTEYLRTSGAFCLAGVENERDLFQENLRWTVDDERDLQFVRAVYDALGKGKHFLMNDVLELLNRCPELRAINRDGVRNEGLYLSLLRENTMLRIAPRRLTKTQELLVRSKQVIPSQTQTFSKGPKQFVQGVSPAFLERGRGGHVWDVDGNEYVDYILGLCPVVLGYDFPEVTEAVVRQVRDGASFSLPHRLEVELAEKLTEIIPCADMVRFGKNGSDATAGAVRAARAFTRREMVACCGYHGWQDWFIGTTTRRLGVPRCTQELTLTFEYNKLESLEKLFAEHPDQIAAVIMEPFSVTEPKDDFLARVKEVTHAHGAVLIFDEIVTGFRIALGGAQEHFGVAPDLACFGKAMANGFPLSAVVGKRHIMEIFDEIFFSFTFGGEAVALAAALATIEVMQTRPVIGHLWEQGQKLKDGWNVMSEALALRDVTRCIGFAPRSIMTFEEREDVSGLVMSSLVQQEMVKRGVLYHGGCNLSFSHDDADIEHTLRAFRESLEYLAQALKSGQPRAYLDNEPAQPVFRKVA
jgi:glutamate-1-semialdehyde aminotransferase/spore coat polysaccharide biosynthesis protein SpsF (cytidylyltransferase family)